MINEVKNLAVRQQLANLPAEFSSIALHLNNA